jgi:xylulokinase
VKPLGKSIVVIAYDIGTTGVKTCLFEISDQLRLIDSSYAGYGLYVLEDGGVEQEPDEWWSALCATTRALLKKTRILPGSVSAVSFCSQMQGLVLVDREGRPVRRAMSYLDSRARRQFSNGLAYGLKMNGLNARKLATRMQVAGC